MSSSSGSSGSIYPRYVAPRMSRRLDGGDPGSEVPALPAPEREIRATMLEYAEEPGLWIPLAPPSEVLAANGYAVVTSLYSASVERVRLGPDDVERAVEEV